jgi:hypothetical protein
MLRLCVCVSAAFVLCQRAGGFDTGLTFAGGLERVGDQSISVKLADRRVIDAMVGNAESIAAKYRMGDEVEIQCKPIAPVWEAATSRFQSLEVTAIRFLQRPSPEEVGKMLEARPREGKNLLDQPDVPLAEPNREVDLNAPGGKELENARRVNLEYVANMPNFVADEVAKRFRSTARSPGWSRYDTVESEITFRGRRAMRQQIRRNGKPWDQPFDALPGFKWYEGFETEIGPLFDRACPTMIEYQGRSRQGGRQVLDYRFSSPVDGCFPFLYFNYERYNPARNGHIYIGDPSGNVLRVDDEASGFPAEFEFAQREEHVSWDFVKIGDNTHLLPVRTDFLVRYSSGTRYRVEVEYKNHRHFESSSNLTFK